MTYQLKLQHNKGRFILRVLSTGGQVVYPGLYKAIVVNNQDYQRRNRIQVRIPFLHGISQSAGGMSNDSLPWALPCSFFTSDPPLPVGTIVWVMFEGGIPTKPIYMGYLLKFSWEDLINENNNIQNS